jgi:geranylgeranyl diphosphate synthase, type III
MILLFCKYFVFFESFTSIKLYLIFRIDDLQDGASFRKEKPVAHSIFSVGLTINSASQTFFHAIEKVQKLDHPDAIKVYNEQLLELHRGQGIEIYWRDNFICPTEDEYMFMVVRKTGGLYKLIMRLMQLFSDNKTDFNKFLALLGKVTS